MYYNDTHILNDKDYHALRDGYEKAYKSSTDDLIEIVDKMKEQKKQILESGTRDQYLPLLNTLDSSISGLEGVIYARNVTQKRTGVSSSSNYRSLAQENSQAPELNPYTFINDNQGGNDFSSTSPSTNPPNATPNERPNSSMPINDSTPLGSGNPINDNPIPPSNSRSITPNRDNDGIDNADNDLISTPDNNSLLDENFLNPNSSENSPSTSPNESIATPNRDGTNRSNSKTWRCPQQSNPLASLLSKFTMRNMRKESQNLWQNTSTTNSYKGSIFPSHNFARTSTETNTMSLAKTSHYIHSALIGNGVTNLDNPNSTQSHTPPSTSYSTKVCSHRSQIISREFDIMRLLLLYLALRPNCPHSHRICNIANEHFNILSSMVEL